MSKIFDALRRAESSERASLEREQDVAWGNERDFRVVSVTSNKGGVGKTTVAANLAVYARALREDLSVLLFGFDDQTTLDRMFCLEGGDPGATILSGLREGSLARVARLGQYGIDYVPSCRDVPELKKALRSPQQLREILLVTKPQGLVVIDTKSDFEILTQAAIDASDLVIVVVKDQASLIEARRVFDRLAKQGRPLETARVLLSLVDLRVKYREGEDIDVMSHLLSEIRRDGLPLFETFLSRSPKVESLYTNPEGRALSIVHGAPHSIVHRQMRQITEDVLKLVN